MRSARAPLRDHAAVHRIEAHGAIHHAANIPRWQDRAALINCAVMTILIAISSRATKNRAG